MLPISIRACPISLPTTTTCNTCEGPLNVRSCSRPVNHAGGPKRERFRTPHPFNLDSAGVLESTGHDMYPPPTFLKEGHFNIKASSSNQKSVPFHVLGTHGPDLYMAKSFAGRSNRSCTAQANITELHGHMGTIR